MLLAPRYEGAPVFAIEGPADDQHEPLVRQRRRMEATLTLLTEQQWKSPSRCDEWSVQDVVAHLIGTNRFWSASIKAGLAGSPTRLLAAFDPAATPSLMVEPMRSMTAEETLEQFVDSNRSMFDAVESLNDAGWSTLAESPAGHVPIRVLAHHALWDAWIHERDIVLPLELPVAEEPDEVVSCLRYVAAIAPALALSFEPDRTGSLVIDATEPDVRIVVEAASTVVVRGGEVPAGAICLRGRAVDLIDMLSIRAAFDQPVAEESRWLVTGLATVFDSSVDRA